jgi:hypothetical protein
MRIFSWLLSGSPDSIQVRLMPADAEARTLPGFQTGGLTLTALAGDTLGKVMGKFNQFRGPDSQINTLYTQDGAVIPFTTVLTSSVTVVVRKS